MAPTYLLTFNSDLHVLLAVNDARTERFFVRLPLEDLLLDGTDGEEAIDVALLLLTVTPHAGHRLLVVRWVPI